MATGRRYQRTADHTIFCSIPSGPRLSQNSGAQYLFCLPDSNSPDSPKVFATLVLDTIHMIAITHVVYYYLITNYYNKPALQIVVWSRRYRLVSRTLVQSFYAFRVYRISDKNVLLTVVILLLVGATSGCGIGAHYIFL
ncbi:hypothetical protein K438DRAFT_1782821 [Mycena galopus ATCC 62051]|nr:hypothetical protein K438DRAFT_1782821 [Mycena galopus ATCC 62051]